MYKEDEDIQLTKFETVLAIGVIGCLLFATWELGHLLVDEWLYNWVNVNSFVRERIILYGIAFIMSVSSVFLAIKYSQSSKRFIQTLSRTFLWYGTLLLISTIAIFVFDCLPEVFAGFIGAGVFIFAIFVIQKKYFTDIRKIKKSLDKGMCYKCGSLLHTDSIYCSNCKEKVGVICSCCNTHLRIDDKFCYKCGEPS